MNIKQKKALFFSLKEQYESGRPMTKAEEKKMWDLSGEIWQEQGNFLGMKVKKRTN